MLGKRFIENACTAQITFLFLGFPHRQMAGSGGAVLDLTCAGETKTLFCALVGFLLRHGNTYLPPGNVVEWETDHFRRHRPIAKGGIMVKSLAVKVVANTAFLLNRVG